MNFQDMIVSVFVIISNLLIIFGIGYAVFILHHSGWWFLLSPILITSVKFNREDK